MTTESPSSLSCPYMDFPQILQFSHKTLRVICLVRRRKNCRRSVFDILDVYYYLMKTQILSASDRTTINWTSGTSTEIFIYPSAASFAERNFLFRISTATVEAEESTFTFFKGVTRHLMILKGELELIHEGRYKKHLEPFDQDTFSGEWSTHSKGKVTDFNLMVTGTTTGSLKHRKVRSGSDQVFTSKSDYYFVYIALGESLIDRNTAKSGDLVCFEKDSALTFHAVETCEMIEIEVNLNQ